MDADVETNVQNMINVIPIVAYDLLAKYGLREQGWTFAWMDKKKRVSECSYRDKQIRYSINFLTSPVASIGNTLLHEIAHALAGRGHHHDDYWRAIAKRIGCTGDRCTANHISTTDYRYTLRCIRCKWSSKRSRLPHNVDEYVCRRCNTKILVFDNHAER